MNSSCVRNSTGQMCISFMEVILMEINELITLISNLGFPVAISAYLLIRLEKNLTSLTASINKLNTIVSMKLGILIDNEKDKNVS